MEYFTFNQAMEKLYHFSSRDKRELNKLFRCYCVDEFKVKLSVKEADYYVLSFSNMRKECLELASKSLCNNEKFDFEDLIFSNYPELSEQLKNEWIQEAHLAVFR